MARRQPLAQLLVIVLVVALGGLVGACSASGASTAIGGGGLTVSDAWARAAAKGGTSAAYLTVANGRTSDDVLVGVSTDAADAVGLHQTMTDDSGMTGMQHTDSISVKAGQTVKLEPGGYHVMLEGLKADLVAGQTIRLVLTFERSGPIDVTAEVRAG